MSDSAKFVSANFHLLAPPQPWCHHPHIHATAASAIVWVIRDQCSWSAENRGHEFHRDWRWVRHLVRISNLCPNFAFAIMRHCWREASRFRCQMTERYRSRYWFMKFTAQRLLMFVFCRVGWNVGYIKCVLQSRRATRSCTYNQS